MHAIVGASTEAWGANTSSPSASGIKSPARVTHHHESCHSPPPHHHQRVFRKESHMSHATHHHQESHESCLSSHAVKSTASTAESCSSCSSCKPITCGHAAHHIWPCRPSHMAMHACTHDSPGGAHETHPHIHENLGPCFAGCPAVPRT